MDFVYTSPPMSRDVERKTPSVYPSVLKYIEILAPSFTLVLRSANFFTNYRLDDGEGILLGIK